MIEAWFKNWHIQENQLHKLENMGRGAYYSEYGNGKKLKVLFSRVDEALYEGVSNLPLPSPLEVKSP